jgi:hypothetical protein
VANGHAHTAHQLEQTTIGGVRHPEVMEMDRQELGRWLVGCMVG